MQSIEQHVFPSELAWYKCLAYCTWQSFAIYLYYHTISCTVHTFFFT